MAGAETVQCGGGGDKLERQQDPGMGSPGT